MKFGKIVFCALLFFSQFALADCPASMLSEGGFLRGEYLEYLSSVRKVAKNPPSFELNAMKVAVGENVKFMFIWGMHEGDVERVLSIDCSLRRVDGELQDDLRYVVEISDRKSLWIISPQRHEG